MREQCVRDGYVGPGELCDDGNSDDGDRCTAACSLATCGDGRIQRGEQCDDGVDNDATGSCLPSCTVAACGDLFVQAGVELCDAGNVGAATCASEGFDGGSLACTRDCLALDTSGCQLCGNELAEGEEECDDTDLRGETCASQGSTQGTLVCNAQCEFDTSGCVW